VVGVLALVVGVFALWDVLDWEDEPEDPLFELWLVEPPQATSIMQPSTSKRQLTNQRFMNETSFLFNLYK